MDDLAELIPDETAVLHVLSHADRHSSHAVRTAQGWAACHGADPSSEGCGFGEPVSFNDIADAILSIEDRVSFGWGRMGSEIAHAVLVGQQTSRDGVQYNVYNMSIREVENQTRYRN
jgi:hypothetical protein